MGGLLIKMGSISFFVGIFCGAFWHIDSVVAGIAVFYIVLLCMVFKKKWIIVVLISLLFIGAGIIRYNMSLPVINETSVHHYQDEWKFQQLEGTITEDPDRRREKVNYILDVSSIKSDNLLHQVKGRILISTNLYPEYQYGDVVQLNGILKQPQDFESFSYSNYLSLFGVYSIISRPRINTVSQKKGSLFFEYLFNVKHSFENQLNHLFSEPMASFEAGLLTGSRKGIAENLMNSFNITGLTHIIAISGYNISLIIVLVSSFLKSFSRNHKIPIVIIFIILFTLFVGASAAVVRAAIMGLIAVIALWTGRQSQVLNALLLSGFFMVLYKPQTLLYDVGFQLSFLATFGLIVSGNTIMKWFSWLPDIFGIKESFAMTISAQVFALPVIVMNFERFSLVSPIANILVAPFIPFAMLFGFIATVFSYFSWHAGMMFMFPAWLFLKIIIVITHFLAQLPYASLAIEWFSMVHLILYYFVCLAGGIWWYLKKRDNKKKELALQY